MKKLLLVICLLLATRAEAAVPSLVNTVSINYLAGGTTTATTAATSHTTGNFLSLTVFWQGAQTISSIADTAMNTYSLCGSDFNLVTINHVSFYYAKNITGNASNQTTITFSAGTTGVVFVSLKQYSGVDTTSPCDTTKGATGTGTTADTGNFTTAVNDEVIDVLHYFTVVAYSTTAGTGYTKGLQGVDNYVTVEYRTDTSTAGTNSATMTWATSDAWAIQCVTYKPLAATNTDHNLSSTGAGK